MFFYRRRIIRIFVLILSLFAVENEAVCMNYQDNIQDYPLRSNDLSGLGERIVNANGTPSGKANMCIQGVKSAFGGIPDPTGPAKKECIRTGLETELGMSINAGHNGYRSGGNFGYAVSNPMGDGCTIM